MGIYISGLAMPSEDCPKLIVIHANGTAEALDGTVYEVSVWTSCSECKIANTTCPHKPERAVRRGSSAEIVGCRSGIPTDQL